MKSGRNRITRKRKAEHGEKIYLIKAILLGRLGAWYGVRVRGRPYRIVAIPRGFTLYNLAEAIVKSFGFSFDHYFGFYSNMENWARSKEEYVPLDFKRDDEKIVPERKELTVEELRTLHRWLNLRDLRRCTGIPIASLARKLRVRVPKEYQSVEEAKVSTAFNKIRKRLLGLFDYGDEWHFIVELKGIESPKENVKYPFIVKSVGEAPPQYE